MSNTQELVFVPVPEMGHILSTVQLTKRILQRNQIISISIYILKLPNAAANVYDYVESQLRDNPYPSRLTFVTCPPLANPPNPSTPIYPTVIQLHKPILKKAVEDRVGEGFPKPIAFVFDMFCAIIVDDVANELGIPSYVFFTSGANALNLQLYAQSLIDDYGVDVVTEFSDPGFTAVVPGFKNPVSSKVIPSAMQVKSPFCEMLMELPRRFRKIKGILINSYAELETLPIQALLNSDTKIPPVYPVGPLVELTNKGGVSASVIEWLDRQPESSVAFLCFGSLGIFVEEQVKEIANGLEKSGHRFLWSLRKPPPAPGTLESQSDNEAFLEALPEGFTDRTNDRGKIIGWAPQVAILAHPAIGGFVSHCGWNSTLECLWFGVPMAAWPLYAEQQLNAFELVKELELAVELRIDYKMDVFGSRNGNFLVNAVEIENAVKSLMSMDEKMKEKVKKKSEEGKKALEEGGSSYKSLGCFIERCVKEHCLIYGQREVQWYIHVRLFFQKAFVFSP